MIVPSRLVETWNIEDKIIGLQEGWRLWFFSFQPRQEVLPETFTFQRGTDIHKRKDSRDLINYEHRDY